MKKEEGSSNYLLAYPPSLSAWVSITLHEQPLSSFEILIRSILGTKVRAGDKDSVRFSERFTPGKDAWGIKP